MGIWMGQSSMENFQQAMFDDTGGYADRKSMFIEI